MRTVLLNGAQRNTGSGAAAPSEFATGSVFASDTFTDTSGLTLASHTPNAGGPWVQNPQSTAVANISNANRVRGGAAGLTSIYNLTATPTNADYDISWVTWMESDNNAGTAGVIARFDATAQTGYHARYNTNGDIWQVYEVTTGTFTLIGSSAQVLNVDQSYACIFTLRGTNLRMYVDTVKIIDITDATHSVAGLVGVRMNNAQSDTVGLHLDTFSAKNYS